MNCAAPASPAYADDRSTTQAFDSATGAAHVRTASGTVGKSTFLVKECPQRVNTLCLRSTGVSCKLITVAQRTAAAGSARDVQNAACCAGALGVPGRAPAEHSCPGRVERDAVPVLARDTKRSLHDGCGAACRVALCAACMTAPGLITGAFCRQLPQALHPRRRVDRRLLRDLVRPVNPDQRTEQLSMMKAVLELQRQCVCYTVHAVLTAGLCLVQLCTTVDGAAERHAMVRSLTAPLLFIARGTA